MGDLHKLLNEGSVTDMAILLMIPASFLGAIVIMVVLGAGLCVYTTVHQTLVAIHELRHPDDPVDPTPRSLGQLE